MGRVFFAKASGIGSICVGLIILFLLTSRHVYVKKNEFVFFLVYSLISIAAVPLFLQGRKKRGRVLIILSLALLFGIPLIFNMVSRPPSIGVLQRLGMIGLALIPALFFLLGILALSAVRWSYGILMAVFSFLGLYLIILAAERIAKIGALCLSDILTVFPVALILFALAFINFRMLKTTPESKA